MANEPMLQCIIVLRPGSFVTSFLTRFMQNEQKLSSSGSFSSWQMTSLLIGVTSLYLRLTCCSGEATSNGISRPGHNHNSGSAAHDHNGKNLLLWSLIPILHNPIIPSGSPTVSKPTSPWDGEGKLRAKCQICGQIIHCPVYPRRNHESGQHW